MSPKHPPSAEQKKISPYKYLKDSLDVPELNKVRGSLLAKLESIAAQEGEFVSWIINQNSLRCVLVQYILQRCCGLVVSALVS